MKPSASTADCVFGSILSSSSSAESLLIEADIHQRSTAGWHLLHAATIVGNVGLLTSLLDRGAEIHATCLPDDSDDRDPANQRIFSNYDFIFVCEWSCLQIACMMGHADVVSTLLERGANVNMAGDDGNTPLHCAARFGDVAVVELLIAEGAAVNARTDEGSTPLHFATRNNRHSSAITAASNVGEETVPTRAPMAAAAPAAVAVPDPAAPMVTTTATVEDNASIDEDDDDDDDGHSEDDNSRDAGTIGWSHAAVMQALLANGADVNAQDDEGWTALLLACFYGYSRAVQVLVENGADVNLSVAALSPLDVALVENNTPLLRVLAAHGATVSRTANDDSIT